MQERVAVRRKKRLLVAAMFAIGAMLVGHAMFASASDSATSQGNNVASNEFQPQDVKIAVNHDGGSCSNDPADYADGPVPEAIDSRTFNLNSGSAYDGFDTVCIMNAGDFNGELHVSFVNVVDTEDGACSVAEAAVDSTCTNGGQGELSPVLRTELDSDGNGSASICRSTNDQFDGFSDEDAGLLLAHDVCGVHLFTITDASATKDQQMAASTDKVTWDMVFTLEATS